VITTKCLSGPNRDDPDPQRCNLASRHGDGEGGL
jgi:hypothetical protein